MGMSSWARYLAAVSSAALQPLLLNRQQLARPLDLGHHIARKFHVDDRADDLYDSSAAHVRILYLKVQFCLAGGAAGWATA